MLKNYLKIAIRQLWKNKLFSALNIFGLATSMSVCLLLIMILADQYGYDNFHEKGDRIFRVTSASSENQRPQNPSFATTSITVAEELQNDYPFIENVVRIMQFGAEVRIEEKAFNSEVRTYLVDQDFLNTFSFGWTVGDKRTALLKPRSIVLTESAAKRFFPYSDPMGATMTLSKFGEYTVTGILPDPPIRSHIRFDYLTSFATVNVFTEAEKKEASIYDGYEHIWRSLVYVALKKNATQKQLDTALEHIADSYSSKHEEKQFLFTSQALRDILPSKELSNEIGVATPSIVLYFLMALGLIIIFSACFNYTALSIARSLKRTKEIGVRKVMGAKRKDILFQFLGESIIVAFLSLLIAMLLLELLIPLFFDLDPFVSYAIHLEKTLPVYLLFLLFSLAVGLVAGLLPALSISKLRPIQAIQKLANIQLFSKTGVQKILITVQFTLSLILILTVSIVLRQQEYVLNTDYGISAENIYNIRLGNVDYELFSQKVKQIAGVESIAATSAVLLTGEQNRATAIFQEGQDSMQLFYSQISPNYLSTVDIELIAGKNLPENRHAENEQFIVLNEKAVNRMGFPSPEAAIGQSVAIDEQLLSIIGVVRNFYHDDIWFEPIQPFGFRENTNNPIRNVSIKFQEAQTKEVIASIHAVWKELSPESGMNAFFIEERVNHLSKFFKMGSRIIGFIGLLTIIIACMGLLGIVLYTVEGKLKEVGIRKVLGASKSNIVWQLSKGFLLLLASAIIIATPLTIFGATAWLQNFAIQTNISLSIVVFSISIILLLGLITVISQTYWAARSNPVESLRQD